MSTHLPTSTDPEELRAYVAGQLQNALAVGVWDTPALTAGAKHALVVDMIRGTLQNLRDAAALHGIDVSDIKGRP